MSRMNNENVLRAIFGPKGKELTDKDLENGLYDYSQYLLANRMIEEGYKKGDNVSEYMKKGLNELIKEQDNLISFMKKNYNFKLDTYKDFTTAGEGFYANHAMAFLRFNAYGNEQHFYDILSSELRKLYYTTGAAIRDDQEDFQKYYAFFDGKEEQMEKKFQTFKEKELKALYKDYVLGKEPGIGTKYIDRLTPAQKKDVLKNITTHELLTTSSLRSHKILNILPVSDSDLAASDDYYIDHDAPRNEFDYKVYCTRKAMAPDLLDKENVKALIEVARTVSEVHAARSRWTRFWGYLGKIGKENDFVNEIKNHLIERGFSKKLINDAIAGKNNGLEKCIAKVPTREERLILQKKRDADYFADIMKLSKEEVHKIEMHCCRYPDQSLVVCGAKLKPEDIAMFIRPDTMAAYEKEKFDFKPFINEKDRKEIENAAPDVNELNQTLDNAENKEILKDNPDVNELNQALNNAENKEILKDNLDINELNQALDNLDNEEKKDSVQVVNKEEVKNPMEKLVLVDKVEEGDLIDQILAEEAANDAKKQEEVKAPAAEEEKIEIKNDDFDLNNENHQDVDRISLSEDSFKELNEENDVRENDFDLKDHNGNKINLEEDFAKLQENLKVFTEDEDFKKSQEALAEYMKNHPVNDDMDNDNEMVK